VYRVKTHVDFYSFAEKHNGAWATFSSYYDLFMFDPLGMYAVEEQRLNQNE
jgi:hypothetical protein